MTYKNCDCTPRNGRRDIRIRNCEHNDREKRGKPAQKKTPREWNDVKTEMAKALQEVYTLGKRKRNQ